MLGSGIGKENLQEKYDKKYDKLMQESFALSTVNRKKSDIKRAKAQEIGNQLDELEKTS